MAVTAPAPPRADLVQRALDVGYRAALGVLGDRHAAEDVAQEVALVALRRGHTVRDPERLEGWLYRVAVRAALKQTRRDRDRREREWRRQRLEPAVPEELEAPLELLDGLPPRQRAALTMRYVFDLPDDVIARALRCRQATVRTLLHRGRAAIRARLEKET